MQQFLLKNAKYLTEKTSEKRKQQGQIKSNALHINRLNPPD